MTTCSLETVGHAQPSRESDYVPNVQRDRAGKHSVGSTSNPFLSALRPQAITGQLGEPVFRIGHLTHAGGHHGFRDERVAGVALTFRRPCARPRYRCW